MSNAINQEFGALRALIWPIHRHELRKLLPMWGMLFLICFNYSILRNMKDSVVITAAGAEVLPFIKVWVLLPTAVFLTILFTKLSNRFSLDRVFYIMITIFLSFFALFGFVLYPLRDVLHPTMYAASLLKVLPAGCKGLVAMGCNWTFTAFYAMAELWSTSILSVLFWGFANEITTVAEARRFYGVLGIGASVAAIVAGQFANFITYGRNDWDQTLTILILVVITAGITTMALFRWMDRNVLNNPRFASLHQAGIITPKKKQRLSIRESFRYLANSKYLLCIATIVVSYNLVIHMTEVIWKDQLARLYPNPSDYNIYMNNVTSATGLFATFAALFMAKIIDYLGWTKTALIPPIIMAVTCAGFFGFVFLQEYASDTFVLLTGLAPLTIAALFGAAQNSLSKAAKYSVFDATKEMTFIPLSHESKLKGKAAIDGVGSRIGKSGGAIMHQGLLMIFVTFTASAPYVAVILMGMIVFWMLAVRSLGAQFNALVAKTPEAVATTETAPEQTWTAGAAPQVASNA